MTDFSLLLLFVLLLFRGFFLSSSGRGTCGDDAAACYPDTAAMGMIGMTAGNGWLSEDPWSVCTTECTGAITPAQQAVIDAKCNAAGKAAFDGTDDEYAMFEAEGAANAGAANMMGCFDTAFASTASDAVCPGTGCSWEGTCDTDKLCWNDEWTGDAWLADGNGFCIGKCEGGITMEEENKLHDLCNKDAMNKFMSAGGDPTAWDNQLEMGAATAATNGMENCFDKAFNDNNYK